MVDAKAINASAAYTDALKRATDMGAGSDVTGMEGIDGSAKPSFSEMLESATTGAIEATKGGEDAGIRAAAQDIDMVDVVTAITNAEITLQTVIAVRDKVIESYEKIIQMPI